MDVTSEDGDTRGGEGAGRKGYQEQEEKKTRRVKPNIEVLVHPDCGSGWHS